MLLPAMEVITYNGVKGNRRIATINSIDLWIHYFRQYILSNHVPYKPVIKVCNSHLHLLYTYLVFVYRLNFFFLSKKRILWMRDSNEWNNRYTLYSTTRICLCMRKWQKCWFICRVIRALRIVTSKVNQGL